MKLIYLLRNSIQWILINLLKVIKPFTRSKIFLFSQFMANDDAGYFLTVKGKERYIVLAKDVGVSRKLYIGAADEYKKVCHAVDLVKKIRKSSFSNLELLIDVGANLGHIFIPMLVHDLAKNAVAFEPDPNNFRICTANVWLNSLNDKVVLHHTALGANQNEFLDFELSDENFGDHRVRVIGSEGSYSEAKRKVIKTPSTTLDSFFNTLPDPSSTILWIDVQGYEGFVLEGAKKLLQSKIPVGIEFWTYGLKRSGSFELMYKNLTQYDFYYDLSHPNPKPTPIVELLSLYERNKDIDFTTDLLLC